MVDYRALEEILRTNLGLDRRPVAIAFRGEPPPGAAKFAGVAPAALAHGTVTSAGCIGNRTYTGIGEDELYAAMPGNAIARAAAATATIAAANQKPAAYHNERRQVLTEVVG